MSDKDNTYKKIIKSTSLFGLVQFSTLFISVVRHKFFAVWVGPAGYGVFSLLYSAFDLVRQGTGFGIEVTGVKKVTETRDTETGSKVSATLIKLSVITGVFGTVVFMALSYNLSFWAFGNTTQIAAILLVSVAVLLRQIIAAQTAVMQGMGRLNYLARTNLLGNLFSLVFTLPLFYFFKIDAILPSILLSAFISLIISYIYYNKMGIAKYPVSFKSSFKEGKDILLFGGLISINGFLPLLSNYIIQLFINNVSGIVEVGLFNTGQLIINSYVGIIFTAMTMEYYPRLITLNKDVSEEGNAISRQAVISMLVLLPIIIIFIECLPLIIRILLSKKFDAAIPMLSWCILAMFFKSVSWCMGYLIIARADSSVFLKTSLFFNTIYILLCITGFWLNGLEGLGAAFLIYYSIHLIGMYLIITKKYGIKLEKEFYKLFFKGLILFCMVALVNYFCVKTGRHIMFSLLFILSVSFSVMEINKRIPVKNIVNKFFKKP